jgi:hypothetical protein
MKEDDLLISFVFDVMFIRLAFYALRYKADDFFLFVLIIFHTFCIDNSKFSSSFGYE